MINPCDSCCSSSSARSASQGIFSDRNMKIGASLVSFVTAVALAVLAGAAFCNASMYHFIGGALTVASVSFFILGILGMISACKMSKHQISEKLPN